DHFFMSALDEPSTAAQGTAADWLYGEYAKYFPAPRTNEAHNHVFPADEPALSTVTPVTSLYDTNTAHYQAERVAGKNLWMYVANVPAGDYMNRFISYPVADTRLMPWLIWKLGGTGNLHWGWNYWVRQNPAGQWVAADTFQGGQSGDAWL